MIRHHASIMGMPVTILIAERDAKAKDIEEVFEYLQHIDALCSTYKATSEISRINSGVLDREKSSKEVQKILRLCEETKKITYGYFDMERNGEIDPSGIVKGYAIHKSAQMLRAKGYANFYIEIAGDIEIAGKNEQNELWRVGIENPFNRKEIIKVIHITDCGIATSGNYIRGQHIYNPITKKQANDIASITVVGPSVYEADRFATAAFAMGEKGIQFIEGLKGCEGYMVKKNKTALYTSGFSKFVLQ